MRKKFNKILAFMLLICMVMTSAPLGVVAETIAQSNEALSAALAESDSYVYSLAINNPSNNPAAVASTWEAEFTWDNEKRESSNKSYLYDWSYYNGVVFEGIDYLYDVTGNVVYSSYVEEYLKAMIAPDGTWTTNSAGKQNAGYVDYHGADCYKTASLLLDYYEITGDSRYLTMAETLYNDLKDAEGSYCSSNRGYNFDHTWQSPSSLNIWLDGLYMILPFYAEYASYTNDTAELDQIVQRLTWVSENMYNESTGLFFHAANSSSDTSGSYWLRSIGWYIAALTDVMDYVTGENLETLKAQLVKLIDGMKAYQNEDNGMWTNYVTGTPNSTNNRYETSGTALMAYGIIKAVNEGWISDNYADMAVDAFLGICENYLEDDNLTNVCFKGAPGSSNATFYDNEGKGAGPFIMAYAEVYEYAQNEAVVPENQVTIDGTTIIVDGVENLIGTVISSSNEALIEGMDYDTFRAYDINGTITGETATVTIPVPAEWVEERVVGFVIDHGEVVEVEGSIVNGKYIFDIDAMTPVGIALLPIEEVVIEDVMGNGNIVGGKVYTLDTDGVNAGEKYLIVNTNRNTGYALTNNNNASGRTAVTISNNTITVEDDSRIAWTFSGSTSGNVSNNGRYINPSRNSLSLSTSSTNLTISNQRNGAYRVYRRSGNTSYYVRYNNNSWSASTSSSNVYLYRLTSESSGEEVIFRLSPGGANLKPGDTKTLNGIVTVNGTEVDISSCTINWATENRNVATVSNGTVTAVADGTTNITATLTEVDGTALKEAITLTVPVSVRSKTIVSTKLEGNTPVRTLQNVEPDFSDIVLKVLYDDETVEEFTIKNGLEITGYDITTVGHGYATISYNGVEYGTVRITVDSNLYEGLQSATHYPEYPEEGAVRIDKGVIGNASEFNNTGVAQVHLDVAGVSEIGSVNVLLVSDISNSMSWNDETYDYSDTTVSAGTSQRLNASKHAAKLFAQELLSDNEGDLQNTFTLLAFAGIDGDYNTHSTAADNDDVYQLGDLAMTDVESAEEAIDQLVKATTGGTNYDYAFQQAYELANELYELNGKDVHIVFMTDGAPTHFDGVYYKSRSSTDLTASMQYIDPVTGATSSYLSTGNDKDGNDIDRTSTMNVTVTYNDGSTETKNVTYNAGWTEYITTHHNDWGDKVKELDFVHTIHCIGFGMANGSVTQGATSSMPTLDGVNGGTYYIPSSATKHVLQTIASSPDDYYEAENEAELDALYKSLATKVKYSGTNARTTDIISEKFTLQTASYSGSGDSTANLATPPVINIVSYELYPIGTIDPETGADLTGQRTGNFETIEQVTFNADGTEAYSDVIGAGQNIMTMYDNGSVIIEASTFTYEKTYDGVETFHWYIGNITDHEVELNYYVYLKGALEGERPEDVYYTNEEAYLEYVDIEGNYAKQIFPIPAIAWGGADTSIRFYLVNEKGQPVNHAGEVVPDANRIYVGSTVVVRLNLNADATIPQQQVRAADHVPEGFFLYDINASYYVQTASGTDNTVVGGITVSEPSEDAFKTTGEEPNLVIQTGAQTTVVVSYEETYYTWSYVAFGVRWDLDLEEADPHLLPDKLVIDYGKPIQVDVLKNDIDTFAVVEETLEVIGFVNYSKNIDPSHIQISKGTETLTSSNGHYVIVDRNTVQFTPHKFMGEIERVFVVVEVSSNVDKEYQYQELTIIPASVMYYETDFSQSAFDFYTTGSSWTVVTDGEHDGPQDKGTIGGNSYGYDSTYENDTTLSNGSSMFVHGQGVKLNENTVDYTEACFSFTGTGFDIISRTGAEQGAIRVNIYSDEAKTQLVKGVTVLNKSDTAWELYQIPVVSVNDLDYATYYVSIFVNAAYNSEMFPELNRGDEFYFDAVRVYDPIDVYSDTEDALIGYDAYCQDGEAHTTIIEVRGNLIDSGTFNSMTGSTEGITFVDLYYGDGETLGVQVSDYTDIGPNNEVYLSKGQAIAFAISAMSIPASVDIGARAISADGTPVLGAKIVSFADNSVEYSMEKTISSCTAQYIDILPSDVSEKESLFEDGMAYVVITNTGEGYLSITDIKLAYSGPVAVMAKFMVNMRTLGVAADYLLAPEEPAEPEEPETPEVPEEPEIPETPEEPEVPEEPTEPAEPTFFELVVDFFISLYIVIRDFFVGLFN